MSCKCLSHWKLANQNFYPISMACTVDNDQQITTIFIASAEQVVSISATKINRVQSEEKVFAGCGPAFAEPLRELKRTEKDVFLIASDGQLMVYDTRGERFKKIDKYDRTLHASQGPERGQLFVVRQKGARTIVLEVIELSEGSLLPVTIKSYDLVLESIDSTARLSVKSLTITEGNEQFLGNFLGFTKVSIGDQVVLIAVNNSLYWLQEQENGECDLIAMRSFASCVVDFDFSESSVCLTVLLQAGVLVIFGQSLVPNAFLVSNSPVFLHAPIEAYAFEKGNNGFLYSNGLSTHRVQFYYSEETKQIVSESKEVPVRGVIAIAAIESESLALLLTENNQFYTIDCTESKQTSLAEVPKMFLLRKDNRSVSRHVTRKLTEEMQFDKRLDEAMQAEQTKFNVLALYQNRTAFENLSRMDVTFHREMPTRTGKVILLGHRSTESVCLYASVRIEINQGFFNLLSMQKQWSVCIGQNGDLQTYPIPDTFSSEGVLRAIVCLRQRDLFGGFPKFRSWLLTTVQSGTEKLLLSITVPSYIQSMEECAAMLIQKMAFCLTAAWSCVKQAAGNIIAQNNALPVRKQEANRIITYSIRNEQSKTKAASFSNLLEGNSHDTWFALDAPIDIRWHGEKAALCVRAELPIALELVKRFLLDNEEYLAEMEQRRAKLKGISLELQAVTDGSLIVQLYRKVRNDDIFEDNEPSSTAS